VWGYDKVLLLERSAVVVVVGKGYGWSVSLRGLSGVLQSWRVLFLYTVRSESRCAVIKTRSSIERTTVSKN
jgi:hypothetical protein